ncbi:hypothetical protein FF011L_36810 [Roseimaritima multifibrata]|uniref:FAD-binding domain-containing protein n=1 Tax=Roseimaritima multifibrata TaxID=1930274 RepID=A0A517MJ66_9BACT|nr:FAD-dependent oxidoreductase [Roseimaritima multifibrata]QDS94898.1 hypothetical protein FF011L_36810 [Roseimaritima multifibrata]
MESQYDVVVIGGGPGGTAAAATVAEAGLRTLLVEREPMPRFHVGESLMPEVYWPLERLGMVDRIREAGFVNKESVQFVSANGKESAPFYFRQHDERECSTTWQVERAEFDQMLFDRAEELGADCYDDTRILDIRMEGERATGVLLRDSKGTEHEIQAKVVVDASGQQSLIANKLKLKEVDPNLKKIAIWSYYKNALRDDGENEGATIILQCEHRKAWFWFIPQSRGVTSIGCVGDRSFLLDGKQSPTEIFEREVLNCPGMVRRLEPATRVGDIRLTKEFSYTTKQHSGEGWVLVGDAFGFIDPVYSSGVYFALEMGIRAGDAIIEGHAKGDYSGDQLGKWAEEFKSGSRWIRKLVDVFYTPEFSIGRFLKAHPQHQGNLVDLLIGRTFHDGAGKIFDDLDPALKMAVEEARK